MLPNITENHYGVDVPLYIIGDSAYPLQSWLMKPFPHMECYLKKNRDITILSPQLELLWRMLMVDLKVDGVV